MSDTAVEARPISTRTHQTNKRHEKWTDFSSDIQALHLRMVENKKLLKTYHHELNQIFDQMTEIRSGQSDYLKQRDQYHEQLDKVAKELKDLEAERASILAEINEPSKMNKEKKTRLQSIKKNLRFQTQEGVDKQIRALEHSMLAHNLSVQEENKLIAQIKSLKAERSCLGQMGTLESEINDQSAVLPLKTRFEEVKQKIKECLARKNKLAENVRELIQSNQIHILPLRELADQRNQIRQKIAQVKAEAIQLASDLAAKTKEHHAQLAQSQKEKSEKMREERRKRDILQEKESLRRQLDELTEGTLTADHVLLQQTIAYIKKFNETPTSPKQDIPPSLGLQPELNDEFQPYMKSKEEEYLFPPKSKKKTDRRKKLHSSTKQLLYHPILVLADLDRLGVDPPYTYEECGVCLEQLEAKAKELEKDQSAQASMIEMKKKKILQQLEELDNIVEVAAT